MLLRSRAATRPRGTAPRRATSGACANYRVTGVEPVPSCGPPEPRRSARRRWHCAVTSPSAEVPRPLHAAEPTARLRGAEGSTHVPTSRAACCLSRPIACSLPSARPTWMRFSSSASWARVACAAGCGPTRREFGQRPFSAHEGRPASDEGFTWPMYFGEGRFKHDSWNRSEAEKNRALERADFLGGPGVHSTRRRPVPEAQRRTSREVLGSSFDGPVGPIRSEA
jgi:hypothetical protein